MQARICLKVVLKSWDLDIWVSSTSFQKNNIGWPQQPPTEKVQISVKIWIFDDPFHKKRPVLVIWLPGGIQPSGAVFFWWNEAVKAIEATEVVEAVKAIEAAEVLRPEKSLLRTAEPYRLLNLGLFWCFERKKKLVESWNIMLNFRTYFCWRLLRPTYVTFL